MTMIIHMQPFCTSTSTITCKCGRRLRKQTHQHNRHNQNGDCLQTQTCNNSAYPAAYAELTRTLRTIHARRNIHIQAVHEQSDANAEPPRNALLECNTYAWRNQADGRTYSQTHLQILHDAKPSIYPSMQHTHTRESTILRKACVGTSPHPIEFFTTDLCKVLEIKLARTNVCNNPTNLLFCVGVEGRVRVDRCPGEAWFTPGMASRPSAMPACVHHCCHLRRPQSWSRV